MFVKIARAPTIGKVGIIEVINQEAVQVAMSGQV
jgi:hypothetical protein